MNTNARGRLLARFLAKIVIIYLILSASPLCKGWHGFLPPKKLFKTQFFDPAPRSNQPQDLSISEWSLMWWQLLQALLQLPQIRKV